jgi:6-phosphogluconate dehydrogenase (decarboxylating)
MSALTQLTDLDQSICYDDTAARCSTAASSLTTSTATRSPVSPPPAALFARFASRQDDAPAMKAIAVMRNAFGGHEVRS